MVFDIFVIGGGVNGAAIARDAAGRGLKVALAEKGDLAGETSSKSTKLFHGGLRYLEYLEFNLVREALREREVLLANMPHIARPMRFVMPIDPDMRFDDDSPVARWAGRLMPWNKGKRPKWMIRSGLFLYDHMGGRKFLPATAALDLSDAPEGVPLKDEFSFAYEYSDVAVDDSRLVALLARDAKNLGAEIMVRTKITQLNRGTGLWIVVDEHGGIHQTRAVVNAAGPWVENVAMFVTDYKPDAHVKLVRGSHIVTKRLYKHDKAYFFNGTDGRIIFSIPYQQEFTLIGTTEKQHANPEIAPVCTAEEEAYLLERASVYFKTPLIPLDVIWNFAGVRPLYDDGAKSATAATREYVLTLNEEGAPIINVFGGKITTHRRLAEDVLSKLARRFPEMGPAWTAKAPLPGGDFAPDAAGEVCENLRVHYPFMTEFTIKRIFRAYGLEAFDIFGVAKEWRDLGQPMGHGLSEREVVHLLTREFACNADDVLWRRTKLGLYFTPKEVEALEKFISARKG